MAHVTILSGLTRTNDIPAPDARRILVLNLMPNRAVTERQIANVFAAGTQPVALTFCLPDTHHIHNNEAKVREAYTSFSQIQAQHFDGLIVTGAPLDRLPFHQIDFWPELRRILTWRKAHTDGALFICWGAYAAGAIDGAFSGRQLTQKISGVYTTSGLTMPQSRFFMIPLNAVHRGQIIAGDDELGATLVEDATTNSWYLAGHLEYQTGTLRAEYYRDYHKDQNTPLPAHYFDADMQPRNTWHNDATFVYDAWLNTLQTTNSRRLANG
ncbi:homoserine O-acetyltransferase/O-succinyltransferase family protein [Lacticaseibacillus sp. GG6-2]